MKYFEFKSNPNICAVQRSNSFGDQIIAVIDIRGQDKVQDPDVQFYAGQIIFKDVNAEGNWTEFTEKNLLKLLKLHRVEITKAFNRGALSLSETVNQIEKLKRVQN